MPITVTVLDTSGIQPFIFNSNVLRENIGASELVHRATRLWAFESLDELEPNRDNEPARNNISGDEARQDHVAAMYTAKFEADGSDKVGAEVVYAGGGNTVVLFQGRDHLQRARDFVFHLGCRILEDAPGLNLYAAHGEYEWGNEQHPLPQVISDALSELGRNKGRDPGSLPALGWPVTAACTSTGLPANSPHPDSKGKTGAASRANRQVKAKWDAADLADERLRGMFPWIEEARFEWTNNFDDLADLRERDEGYIAVVHADGNGMGARIKALTEAWSMGDKALDPRGYIKAMRELSVTVQNTAQAALQCTLEALTQFLAVEDWQQPWQHAIRGEVHYFPVRPIVFGGDDVTLVCAGAWGLAVAQRYLAELERQSLPDGAPPYACAGVAIVKTHYPFSQAHELSEELLKSAKSRVRAITGGKMASALDWHYTTAGLTAELKEIRRREYRVETGPLHMRPLVLDGGHSWRNWDQLTALVEAFDAWEEQRNKTLRLREALRRGPDGVAEFWTIFGEPGQSLPVIDLQDARWSLDNGWAMPTAAAEGQRETQARCVYFDAIEIGEQFFRLPD